jgi:RNA polymerase sigma-70 factor (ECF subfamily)
LKDSWDDESDPLAALREGRSGPFEAFVSAETRRFLGFFNRLGASRSEAEDLVQDTFLKLFRLAASPAPDGTRSERASYDAQGRFLAYAFRVARNVWIDRARRGASRPSVVSDESGALEHSRDRRREALAGATPAGPETRLEREEESARIRGAVAALPDSHRLVFELGIIEELPYTAIAEALDIPVGTVKSRMFHAIKKVRDALTEAERVRDAIQTRTSAGPPQGSTNRSQGKAS